MRVLVLQHMDGGHPWFLGELLREAGGQWTPLHMHRGELPPPRESFDALWVMGGAMQIWEEEEHPWLVDEKRFIRETVESGTPFLGVCLGHQLLAEALGGSVGWADSPEIGLFPVRTSADEDSPFFRGAAPGHCLQWHKAEVKTLPPGAELLAHSEACPVQAMAVGECALGVQYHPEVASGTLPSWCESESAREALVEQFGDEGPGEFQRQAELAMTRLNSHSRRLFENWFRLAGAVRSAR